jgi:hypothetical protein
VAGSSARRHGCETFPTLRRRDRASRPRCSMAPDRRVDERRQGRSRTPLDWCTVQKRHRRHDRRSSLHSRACRSAIRATCT